MNGRTVDFAAVLRDMDVEAEMQAAQSRLAAEDLEAEAIAAGIDVISPAMREALEGLAAVISAAPSGCPECAWGKVAGCWRCGSRVTADGRAVPECAVIFNGGWFEPTTGHFYGRAKVPHAHAQRNLLIRRAAVQADRRFTGEACTGFGGLKPDHEASMRATGAWEAEGESEKRDGRWGDEE